MRAIRITGRHCGDATAFMLVTCLLAFTPTATAKAPADALTKGRAAFHGGALEEAQKHLRQAVDASIGTERGDARHLLMLTLHRQGKHAEAATVARAALSDADGSAQTTLRDELHLVLAKSLEATGSVQEAVKHYDAVIAVSASPHRAAAALRKARALEAAGDRVAAIKAYTDYIERWPAAPAHRDARWALAGLLTADNKAKKARDQLEAIVAQAPRSRAGLAAALALKKLGPGKQTLAERLAHWGAVLDERRFEESVAPLKTLRADAQGAKDRAVERETVKLLVRAYSETRREQEALGLLPELRKLGGAMPSIDKRIRWTALSGDFEGAEKMLLQRHRFKKNDYYWRKLGDLRFAFGRYDGAFKAYRKARGKKTKKVDGEKVEDLSPKMAWALIGMGKPDRALWYLKQRRPRGRRNRQSARYWLARGYQLAGRTEEALSAFDALADEAPYEYYGILAHSRAQEMRKQAPGLPEVAHGIGPLLASPERQGAGLAPSGTILWNAASLTGKFDEAPRPKSRDAQLKALTALVEAWGEWLPETRRALEYARLGFVDRAIGELRVVNSDLRSVRRNGPYSLLRRGRNDLLDNRRAEAARGGARLNEGKRDRDNKTAWKIKRNRRAIRTDLRIAQVSLGDPYGLRRQAFESGRVPKKDDNIALWKRVYPVAFPKLVSTFADHHGVPPYFLYGIMTVESTFHPCAVSVANAYGLLQVIPRTGRRIAGALGYTEFTPELLLEPEMSIYFGSYYLGALLKKYRGQELLAAAAYNAGPHRVDRWLRQNSNRDMDLFVEQIPYDQARNYARSVLEKVARYRRTYHGEKRIYVSNRLASQSLLQPNY